MSTPGTGRLSELSEEDCWARLGAEGVGRIAWTGAEGPTIVPVNYHVEGRRIQLRMAAYSALAREGDDSVVAFEADRLDEAAHSGWSVLVRGRLVFDDDAAPGTGPQPWPAGSRRLHAVITPTSISGRLLE